MKIYIAVIAVLMIAIGAQAGLVNGDFSANDLLVSNQVDAEGETGKWVTPDAAYSLATGVAVRISTIKTVAPRAIGQIFSETLTAGNYNLNFDYNFSAGSAAAPLVYVSLYLFNDDAAGTGNLTINDELRLNQNPTVKSEAETLTFTVSTLLSVQLSEGNSSGEIAFTLTEDMIHLDDLGFGSLLGPDSESDWMGISFWADDLANDTTLTWDNVSIAAVPEPGTLGLVAGVGMFLLLARRLII